MTTTELLAKVRLDLTGDLQKDMQIIQDYAAKYKKEENGAELAAALAEFAFTMMPEDLQAQMRETTFVRDMRMDKAFHMAMEMIRENRLEDAEQLLFEISEKIRIHFEETDKKWFSFRNPFEYHLYRFYYPTVTEFDRAPFDFAHYLSMYGYVLLENHKVQEAAEAVERGIRFNPVSADARFELAEIYKFSGTPDKLLAVIKDTLRICTSASRIARTLCNMGYYCVLQQEFYDAAVFYFCSLRFEFHKPVEFELMDVVRRLESMGKRFDPPTNGQVLDTFEKYGMSPPPNDDLVNLAVTLGQSANEHRQPRLEGLFYRVAYDLTNDPRFKEILDRIDAQLSSGAAE